MFEVNDDYQMFDRVEIPESQFKLLV